MESKYFALSTKNRGYANKKFGYSELYEIALLMNITSVDEI